ncbi:MAG: D-alanine--D-alanine ligase A [Gemmatimonadota bacterium]|nr:MAG: D-alanine--D-alanine ligase A [Gemmatimonadota bacterium]
MRRIGVLMGGESQERDVSRVTGTAVAKALAERGFDVMLLDTAEGLRPIEAPIRDAAEGSPAIGAAPPARAVRPADSTGVQSVQAFAASLVDVDAVFIALHGGWGEDGTIQALFEMLDVPYTGSGVLGSALAMDKDRAKRVMRASGIPTPDWEVVQVRSHGTVDPAEVRRVRESLPGVVIVKPNAEGSTVGLRQVGPGEDLREAIEFAAGFGDRVLVEEFIPGRELTVAVLGEEALPVVEIIPEGGLYSYEAKYTQGRSRYEVPAQLPAALTEELARLSIGVFHALGLEGFARVDYRLNDAGQPFCLEANTIPGMTPLSLVPMAAKANGLSFGELVERIVELGVARGTKRSRSNPDLEVQR